MYHPDITIKESSSVESYVASHNINIEDNFERAKNEMSQDPVKSTKTTIPFVKNHELDYAKIITWMGDWANNWVWLVYVLIVILVVTATSNGANLTDGIDGLATGTSAIVGSTFAILAWVSGNIIFANYLNIMFLPNIGELAIFITAFVGATLGFLWHNTHPAEIFMGDTGSLTIGGIIAVIAIIIHKELLVPILCGVFLVENLSVIMQRMYYKAGKKKGLKQRMFKRTPIHDHFRTSMSQVEAGSTVKFKKPDQLYHEAKITVRFWIVTIVLAAITIITLKIR
jgi:phospho-N-acetylmuramoyl-pentapeptide-transferase